MEIKSAAAVFCSSPICSPLFAAREAQVGREREGDMTVEKVDATLADFDGHFERLFGSDDGKVKLLLFLADREPSSTLTWCPDCNVAEPVIYKKLEALQGRDAVLLRAYVGDKPTWRNPSHPWRVDPRFQLKGVPTLIRWEKGAAAARLEDDEAHLGDKIDAVLAATGN